MGVIPIILFYFFISGISAAEYSLGVSEVLSNKSVKSVHFDGKGNTCVLASSNGSYSDSRSSLSSPLISPLSSFMVPLFDFMFPDSLYELNVTHGLIYSRDFGQTVSAMHVSTRGDVYVCMNVNIVSETNQVCTVKLSGSAEFKSMDRMSKLVHLDNDGNFFYLKDGKGIYLFRPNSASPVSVENLEIFDDDLTLTTAFDKLGNLYLGEIRNLSRRNGTGPSVVLITKEALKDEIPQAQVIYESDDTTKKVRDLMVDGENDLWLAIGKPIAPKESSIMKFKNRTLETFLTKQNRLFLKLVSSNDKTYVTELSDGGENSNSTIYSIFTIGADGEVVEIPELKNISLEAEPKVVADKEGQAYVYTSNGEELPSLGVMATIKSNETKPIPITFETSKKKIDSVKFDFNNAMWMVVDSVNVYLLQKGETVPLFVNACSGSNAYVDVNFVTRKVYIGCPNGLFYFVETQPDV